jgi:long-chain acyl-CoA synthetase
LADMHLARLADEAHERLGDYDALWFEGEWLRSAVLHDRGTRLARGLGELGVEPGDRVVVLMANCPEVAISYNAVWRAGGVVTPAIFLLPPTELEHIVSDSGAKLVLATPELAGNVPDGVRVVTTDEFPELESGEPAPIVPRDAFDPAALLYTGGTTGQAKGVLLSH